MRRSASVIQLFFNLQVIKNIYLVAVLKVYHVQMMNCTSSCGRTQSHRDLNFICYNFVVEPHFNLTCKADSTSQKNKYHGFRGLLLKTPDIMEHARRYWHTGVSWMLLWKAEKADLMQSIVRYIHIFTYFLSIYLYISLSIHLCIYLSIYLNIYIYIYISTYIYIYF